MLFINRATPVVLSICIALLFVSCSRQPTCHDEMIGILKSVRTKTDVARNPFFPAAGIIYMDSLLKVPYSTPSQIRYCEYLKANLLLELGEEDRAIALFESLTREDKDQRIEIVWKDMALAYLRQGERTNCIAGHASGSCIMPIQGNGLHGHPEGSEKAIALYKDLLRRDPNDLESRWLMNLAYMTLGKYPHDVPPEFLIPNMAGDTTVKVKPFEDIASSLGLDIRNMAGGTIVEDFDNDGYLDLLTSGWGTTESMHFFHNNADGTFKDNSATAGLKGINGGLNMVQADYNNDGHTDVLVLRGAWKREYGNEPNSLLRNNGDGTFTDVTTQAGMLSFHPTQTATWNDFNNDGWLDVFIGNECVITGYQEPHPCELYINNQDGTFREVARQAGCNVLNYVKGVTSGDYNRDGWKDLYISTMDGERKLLRNDGVKGKNIAFTNVTQQAGVSNTHGRTFPTWFWDYDNDGWLDIFACDYTFSHSLSYYTAAEKLGIEAGNPEKMLLYHNNHDGTFTNVADSLGLDTNVFAMGANFGDIDNDGYLDMYLGSGNPDYKSLVPNKMFKNLGGKAFADVTASARVGHLQKGHGVAFADMDNDGDQDIYIDMGGAYPGDAYPNAFFMNPGQSTNHWISLKLEGTTSNRSAIGSSIKVVFTENGVSRAVYRDVNSGGSFGASPLRREIGIGQATHIDQIEIHWHGSGKTQIFRNIKPDQFLYIQEGNDIVKSIPLKKIDWTLPDRLCITPTLALK